MKRSIFEADWAPAEFELARAKLPEVFSSFWHDISIKLNFDSSSGEPSNGDIEKDHWVFGMSQPILSC